MRTPRRTPWASQSELQELYDFIYAPHADNESRHRAISRMSVYLASPSCPTFIHLIHSLLSVDLMPVDGSPSERQTTRLACAMAIVRFINGLVDPLQTGPYARPISHIAASLKIPQSLIALRHRATHEDLPPLSSLKQAIHIAIEYINQYSFLPSLASTSSDRLPRTSRAETLVGRWKKLTKSRFKGEVSGTEADRDEKTLKRELRDEDTSEIAEALASVGGMISLAKKKRPSLQAAEPTKAALQIWTPLVEHLAQSDTEFTSNLVDHLFSLVRGRSSEDGQGKDGDSASARWSGAVWVLWLWSDHSGSPRVGDDTKKRIRGEVMAALIERDNIMIRLSEELRTIDPVYEAAVSSFDGIFDDSEEESTAEDTLAGLEVADEYSMDVDDTDEALARMESRLAELESRKTRTVPEAGAEVKHAVRHHSRSINNDRPHTGWTRLDVTNWKPRPIGTWQL